MSANPSSPQDLWADDHLGRHDEAIYLTNFLSARYQAKPNEAGFVLAVNADWGMGKSFMIDRWSKEMASSGHPVVAFNSWENDFTVEPLVAFIAELDKTLAPYFSKMPLGAQLHAKWYEQAKAVLVPSLKVVGLALAKHGAGLSAEGLTDIFSGDESSEITPQTGSEEEDRYKFDTQSLGEKLNKAVEETLKSHNNTKQAITAFKQRLASLIIHLSREGGVALPICVFIDELDRCRPDYAIRLLEGIKHLFGVPGIYFIVATNLGELAHSIRAVYGSGFSAERYLKRFFDMEYALPDPDSAKFAEELMSPLASLAHVPIVTGFERIFAANTFPFQGLPHIFSTYSAAFELTLRDQQQAARIIEAALLTLGETPVYVHFLIFLSVLYQKNSQVYHRVVRASNISEATGFKGIFPANGVGFSVPSQDGPGNKVVTPDDIAKIYFDYLNSNVIESRISAYDFPSSLIVQMPQSGEGVAQIKVYLEVVRRAGRFSR